MADDNLAELFKTQQSLTEWLEDINHKDSEAIRLEDNEKRERLKVLKQRIGMPFDQPAQFEATDLADKTQAFTTYLHKHGEELCALRLIPKDASLPKLRMRGKTVHGAYEWFLEQKVDAKKYRADVVPHNETTEWSTIFIVNKKGIQGEIIRGGHHQLTQGFFDNEQPIIFNFDYKKWYLSEDNTEARKHLLQITSHLHVPALETRKRLEKELDATFVSDFLAGYFETVSSKDFGLWFIDYNRTLGKIFADAELVTVKSLGKQHILSGQVGCKGRAKGVVKIVDPDKLDQDFPENAVLVCRITTPAYVPLMKKASAIVTDEGGILSHAAIVARELKKPCIVGAKEATTKLKDDQKILVNADEGFVSISKA